MGRPRNQTPVYKHHKSTGLARCWVSGKWVTLGRYGSPESRAEFARIIAELAAGSVPKPKTAPRSEPVRTVDQLALLFLAHAEQHYRGPDGKPSNEFREFKRSLVPLHKLYGHTPAGQFGPKSLATVRQEMVKGGLSRKLINQRVGRLKRMFRWAVSQELLPVSVYEALRTMAGLQRGRTEARESKRILPVALGRVRATLPFVNAHLRTMIELQLHTGMRPGEACAMRLADIDQTEEVWLYRPRQHKTLYRDHERVIPFGPKARAVIEAFVADRNIDPSAPLFSPFQARGERFAAMRAKRKSKVQPSQGSRRKKNPKLVPATEYTPHTYTHAIRTAAAKAEAGHWHPNQIRHLFGTAVRKDHGLEAAQVLLGHSRADVTQVYSERNLALALKVASEIG